MGTASESADRTAHHLSTVPPMASCNKRWSSALEYRGKEAFPSYSDILIKSSQRLRERSMSPAPPPPIDRRNPPSPYKTNQDYYLGKTKSIYEKEPPFKDFVNNIPLSQSNFYDVNNLSRLKRSFQNMLVGKEGWAQSQERMSEVLSKKHKAQGPGPITLPYIYVYHRNSRR